MNFEHINQLIKDKEWATIVHLIEQKIEKNSVEDFNDILKSFESIDETYRKKYCFPLYLRLWRPALRAGKIKLAKSFASECFEYLIKYKRFPFLNQLLLEFKSEGLLRNHADEKLLKILSGTASIKDFDVSDHWSLFESHPEKWKTSKAFLKTYLIQNDIWTIEQWKLAYEYILNFGHDRDLIVSLALKSSERGKKNFWLKFENFLRIKKINLRDNYDKSPAHIESKNEKFNVNYDELALDVLSGESTPTDEDQKRVIFSLKETSDEEWKVKGHEMLVAFSLLGMELVVIHIAEKLIPLTNDVKKRAGIQWMCAQSLFNNRQYYRVVDIANDVLEEEPLLSEEYMAFEYLKAEAFIKLNRTKMAKDIFLKIKKAIPNYRLVNQRLKEIEAS